MPAAPEPMSVSTQPGHMAMSVMPSSCKSTASATVAADGMQRAFNLTSCEAPLDSKDVPTSKAMLMATSLYTHHWDNLAPCNDAAVRNIRQTQEVMARDAGNIMLFIGSIAPNEIVKKSLLMLRAALLALYPSCLLAIGLSAPLSTPCLLDPPLRYCAAVAMEPSPELIFTIYTTIGSV